MTKINLDKLAIAIKLVMDGAYLEGTPTMREIADAVHVAAEERIRELPPAED